MRRHDDNSQSNNEVNILALFERFAFAILPCELQVARDVVRKQGNQWNKNFVLDEPSCRDVRMIYGSPDGPNRLPTIQIGILLRRCMEVRERKRYLLAVSLIATPP